MKLQMVNLSDLRVIVNQERDSSSGSSSGGHIAPDDQALSVRVSDCTHSHSS